MLRPAPALLVALLGTALIAACGAPPEPLPSAPPTPRGSGAGASGALPSLPGAPAGAYPTNPVPGATNPYPTQPYPNQPYPTQPYPTQPVVPTRTTTTPAVNPAPACGGSPSRTQILRAVRNQQGIPDEPLEVRFGPYCDGGWQFTILGIVGQDEDQVDPLLVLTKGRPTSLRMVAAGADVCDGAESGAPARIKVRACGAA